MNTWSVPRLWAGETAFILGGGPSLASQATERLEGRRVIAVNSSYIAHPFADYLFSADPRWMHEHRVEIMRAWHGRLVTTALSIEKWGWDGYLQLNKAEPPVKGCAGGVALSANPRQVSVRRTSLQGAMNLAVLLGAPRLILLGVDNGPDAKGRTHHHKKHKWPQKATCWKEQRWDLSTMVEPLAARGIEVLNASPGGHLKLWPIVTLDQVLEDTRA